MASALSSLYKVQGAAILALIKYLITKALFSALMHQLSNLCLSSRGNKAKGRLALANVTSTRHYRIQGSIKSTSFSILANGKRRASF